jgi:glycosyltransferase involved in cell wall biosynthesis
VRFVGQLGEKELAAWYAGCRAVLVTSTGVESFCFVGIEAMAHGRPVVAFDVGGIREWLENGITGLAVAPGDTKGMAAAALRLLNDQTLAARLGIRGQQVVEARFRREHHMAGLLAEFEAAIQGGSTQ